jgi:hypothetical protein
MASIATIDGGDRLEQRFELDLARDRTLLAFFNYGTLAISLFTVSTLLVLIIPMHRTSPWLILLSVYAIATRLGVLVARRALGVPRFLTRLDDGDPAVSSAALAVLEQHRSVLARPLARLATDDSDEAPDMSPEDIARAARKHEAAAWRRTGLVCAALWCVATVAIVATLIATRAGPTT